jgi:hypothetical protein
MSLRVPRNMAKNKITISVSLPTSPITLLCPYCKAKPGRDCATSSGGLAIVHLARIKAAASKDQAAKIK